MGSCWPRLVGTVCGGAPSPVTLSGLWGGAGAQELAAPHCVLQKEGEFTLHSRAILEMEQYIRETFPDAVKICNICHSLLIQVRAPSACRAALPWHQHTGAPEASQHDHDSARLLSSPPGCPCSSPAAFFLIFS